MKTKKTKKQIKAREIAKKIYIKYGKLMSKLAHE